MAFRACRRFVSGMSSSLMGMLRGRGSLQVSLGGFLAEARGAHAPQALVWRLGLRFRFELFWQWLTGSAPDELKKTKSRGVRRAILISICLPLSCRLAHPSPPQPHNPRK